ncbi:hypothetical protein BDW75DRAFT_219275 [Aspergillus navahoensis]
MVNVRFDDLRLCFSRECDQEHFLRHHAIHVNAKACTTYLSTEYIALTINCSSAGGAMKV